MKNNSQNKKPGFLTRQKMKFKTGPRFKDNFTLASIIKNTFNKAKNDKPENLSYLDMKRQYGLSNTQINVAFQKFKFKSRVFFIILILDISYLIYAFYNDYYLAMLNTLVITTMTILYFVKNSFRAAQIYKKNNFSLGYWLRNPKLWLVT